MDTKDILPAYTIRYSTRARRVGLRVLPAKGLEVVLPRGTDPSCVRAILQQQRSWIDSALARMGLASGDAKASSLPRDFMIRGGMERIRLYSCGQQAGALTGQPGGEGAVLSERALALPERLRADPAAALTWLRGWVRAEAGRFLAPWLDELAHTHGFVYSGLAFRLQRTRWGSCSARGKLSLNACLLFLPEKLARHIMLHELCHTRELNHKEGFWRLMFALEPDALALDKAMRRAWRYVPPWVLP